METLQETKHSHASCIDNSHDTHNTLNATNINQQIQIILNKAKSLRGYTLGDLGQYLKIQLPKEQHNLLYTKGITGQIIEILLGACANSKPLPDFPELGLEIKTLPIDLFGHPLETTYVCTAPLLPKYTLEQNLLKTYSFDFKSTVVYKKLRKVLWIPILVNNNIRTIANPFIWQPNHDEIMLIERDWLELTEMLYLGNLDKVNSHFGEVLQIRPKAANAAALTTGLDQSGEQIDTLPRGYYLRTTFTKQIYQKFSSGQDILP